MIQILQQHPLTDPPAQYKKYWYFHVSNTLNRLIFFNKVWGRFIGGYMLDKPADSS